MIMSISKVQETFSKIYQTHSWEGKSRSGPGSDPGNAVDYLNILQNLLSKPDYVIQSVVDVGCGDWSLAKNINWLNINYTGIDIVPELIDQLNCNYASETIKFIHADLIKDNLPPADLLIIKDVLQHLSNESVKIFLSQLPRYRIALITNDSRKRQPWYWSFGLLGTEIQKPNSDTYDGGSRPLKLIKKPFNLNARRLATYNVTVGSAIYIKEVLFWENKLKN